MDLLDDQTHFAMDVFWERRKVVQGVPGKTTGRQFTYTVEQTGLLAIPQKHYMIA